MKLKQAVCKKCINGTDFKWIKQDENLWEKGFCLCPYRDDCDFNVRIRWRKDTNHNQSIMQFWKISINELRNDCICRLEHMIFDRDHGKQLGS